MGKVVLRAHGDVQEGGSSASSQPAVVGYATNETAQMMPLSHILATQLCVQLDRLRKKTRAINLGPDGKAQVIVEYKKCSDGSVVPVRIHTVVISAQHSRVPGHAEPRQIIQDQVVKPVLTGKLVDDNTCVHINASGRFVIGGPQANTGISGRQGAADTYGGWGGHSEPVLSGRGPTFIQRSASYAARQVAKSLVKSGLVARCAVRITYAHSRAAPVSINVDSYGSARSGASEDDICNIVRENFDLQPAAICKNLSLDAVRWQWLAVYGHFGREDLIASCEWETCIDLPLRHVTASSSPAATSVAQEAIDVS